MACKCDKTRKITLILAKMNIVYNIVGGVFESVCTTSKISIMATLKGSHFLRKVSLSIDKV